MTDQNTQQSGLSRRQMTAAGFAFLSAPIPAWGKARSTPPRVKTVAGVVEGYWDGDVGAFKGIPYGGPVAGAQRWKRASPIQPWTGVRPAKRYGPRAWFQETDGVIQRPADLMALVESAGPPREEWAPMGEECLTVNVWSPSLGEGANLPVMVWLHGGGLFAEAPPIWWADGQALAQSQQVVVVSIRHRVGVFGFFDLAGLGARDLPDSANVGVLDLVHGLKWVQVNIASFGGSPNNVTIFGESGGGQKVSALLAMPEARGLFHKAIIQSGPMLQASEHDVSTARAAIVLKAAGVDMASRAQLLELTPEQILKADAAARSAVLPTVDGVNLPTHPFDPVTAATARDIPLIIGTTRTEASLLLGSVPGIFDLDWQGAERLASEDLGRLKGNGYGSRSKEMLQLYRRRRPDASASNAFLELASDAIMRFPSIALAERKVRDGQAPVYMYLLSYETDVLGGKLGAPHVLDIPLVFNHPDTPILGTGPKRAALAAQMSGAWAEFARSGRPGHKTLPAWPAYTLGDRATMVFDSESRVENDPGREMRVLAKEIQTAA